MKRLLATTGTIAALIAGPVLAQTALTEGEPGMQGSLATIQEQVEMELTQHGVNYPVEDITMGQLSEIYLIFEDESLSEQQRAEQVQALLDE
jgi:hypothetical protein